MIGLTGGIGSGKSTIAKELAQRGFTVYDCDAEAKRIIAEDKDVQAAIIKLLGEEAFTTNPLTTNPLIRTYNTAYVAQRVFAEPDLLEALNKIVHPAVARDILQRQPDFVESAILFESGLDTLCDKIIVVEAPEEVRIARTIARDYQGHATQENIDKVQARIRAQKKSPASTEVLQGRIYTVMNDGSSVLSSIIDRVCRIAAC